MSKSKKNDNPFDGFNLINGGFTQPESDDDDEIVAGDPAELTDDEDNQSDDEKKRMAVADAKLFGKEDTKKVKEPVVDDTTDETDDEVVTDDNDTDEASALRTFTKSLHEKGVIDFDDTDTDFEESEEGIEKLINKTVQNRIDKWASKLPEDYAKFLEYVQSGGKPKDFLEVYYGNNSWETFDISDEDNQKLAVRENLKLAGESEEDIEDMIEEWYDNGTLEKRAKSAITKLQKYEEAEKAKIVEHQKELEAKKKQSEKEYWDSFKKDLFSKEEVKGFKLTPKMKEKIWETMTVVNKKTGKTAYQEAVESDKDALLLFALQASTGFDVNKLEKQVVSKVSKSLGKMLKNYDKSSKEKISGGSSNENFGDNPFSAFRTAK